MGKAMETTNIQDKMGSFFQEFGRKSDDIRLGKIHIQPCQPGFFLSHSDGAA
jgi:hypothetical protein